MYVKGVAVLNKSSARSNPLRLIILGMLLEKERHPYEIYTTMLERRIDQHTKVQMGSLYYAVDQLAASHDIEPARTVLNPRGQEKTVYRITETGKMLFHELFMARMNEVGPVYHPMLGALGFARFIDPQELVSMLESRIREQEEVVRHWEEVYEEHIPDVPRAVLHMMSGMHEHARTELRWLRRLHADAAAGRLSDIGAPLDPLED
ncbi:Transcriptional regulator, PadR family [Paenibacillus sp. P22]|nr:Transcriptional regulator, PadR family [Paenibacillus sp. P22]